MPYALAHIAAQQAGLLGEVASWPSSGSYRLFEGDPTEGGTELAATGGYAQKPVSGVSWAAVTGEPAIEATLSWTATAAWDGVATHWSVHDSDGTLRFYEELAEELEVAAGGPISTTLTLYYAQDYEV